MGKQLVLGQASQLGVLLLGLTHTDSTKISKVPKAGGVIAMVAVVWSTELGTTATDQLWGQGGVGRRCERHPVRNCQGEGLPKGACSMHCMHADMLSTSGPRVHQVGAAPRSCNPPPCCHVCRAYGKTGGVVTWAGNDCFDFSPDWEDAMVTEL